MGITSQHSWLSKSQSKSDFCSCSPANQGRKEVIWSPGQKTSLAPPWSKFGAPMVESEFFRRQIYCIEESTCDIVGTFRRLQQWFSAPKGNWRPKNCAPLPPSLRPCCQQPTFASKDFLPLSKWNQKEKLNEGCWSRKINVVYSRLDMAAMSTHFKYYELYRLKSAKQRLQHKNFALLQ